jgi:hypothetical protein
MSSRIPCLAVACSVALSPLLTSGNVTAPTTRPAAAQPQDADEFAKALARRLEDLLKQQDPLQKQFRSRVPELRVIPAPPGAPPTVRPPSGPFYAPTPTTTPPNLWESKNPNSNTWHYLVPVGRDGRATR